jgi:hypothetical protein
VFRPLESFPEEERARWERYILSGGAPRCLRPAYRNYSSATDAPAGLLAPDEGDHADVRLVDANYYVCPWRMHVRVLAAVLAVRDALPSELADTFVPEQESRQAARELAKLKRREAAAFPSMLQSPWHVPVQWFVLTDDEDRHLVEAHPGPYRLYYWTPIAQAKRRAERALQILRRTELTAASQTVRELAHWLAGFDPTSRVELDYGGLCSLFTWDELDNDHSGREIQHALEILTHPGGLARAGELYQTVVNRWAEVKARESLN